MKTIKDNEYLMLKISCKEALYRATKALTEGKEDCSFKIEENQSTDTRHPDFKGYGAAAWINTEKTTNEKKPSVVSENVEL